LRTVTCLPFQLAQDTDGANMQSMLRVKFPRGITRQQLFKAGLIAKMNISQSWTEDKLTTEITNLFQP